MTIKLIKGTTCSFEINVTDANGDHYELQEGEIIRFGVKRNFNSTECLILKEITNAVEGKYIVNFVPADTANLEAGKYFYDVGLQSGTDYYNVIPVDVFLIENCVTGATAE